MYVIVIQLLFVHDLCRSYLLCFPYFHISASSLGKHFIHIKAIDYIQECNIIQYTIVACCDGIHGVLYTRGGKWHPRPSRGCQLPPRVYKTHIPQSQLATIVLLYLGNNVIIPPLSSVVIFKHYYDRVCIVY